MVADNFGEDSLKPLKSLEVLELQANNIDKFPTSSTGLANLKSVQEIRFDSCPLLAAVPRSLPSSVTTLSFSLCRSLVKFVGDAAKPLKNLRVLDLSLTKLTSLPEDVSQLAQLEVLDLQDTALTALPSMAALTSLRELVLHGVDLQDAGFVEDVSPTTEILQLNKVPVNLTSMREVPLSALRTLNLNFMADEPESNTFPSDFLKNMPALTYLSFANAQFSSPRPLPSGVFGGQGGCGSLTFLSLQESGFNAIADGAFAGCSNLDHLDFRDNSITAITAATFVGLTNLRYLNLDNNDISSIEEGAWRHLTQLEQLQLSGNGLTVLPGFDSSVAYALKLIRLNDNDLTQFPDSILTQSSGLSHVEVQNNQLSFFPWKLVQRPFRQFSIKGNNISEVPALHNLLETAIDSTFDISDNALTVLPESFLQFIGRWGLVDVSNNQIEVISRSALGRHIAFPWKSNAGVRGGTGGDPMQLRMAGNPSVCKYEGNSDFQDRFDRFTLACECADSDRVTAASTYCASKEDIPCPVGQYQRDGEDGSREVRWRATDRIGDAGNRLRSPVQLLRSNCVVLAALCDLPQTPAYPAHPLVPRRPSASRVLASSTRSPRQPLTARQPSRASQARSTMTTTSPLPVCRATRRPGATFLPDQPDRATTRCFSARPGQLTRTATRPPRAATRAICATATRCPEPSTAHAGV